MLPKFVSINSRLMNKKSQTYLNGNYTEAYLGKRYNCYNKNLVIRELIIYLQNMSRDRIFLFIWYKNA